MLSNDAQLVGFRLVMHNFTERAGVSLGWLVTRGVREHKIHCALDPRTRVLHLSHGPCTLHPLRLEILEDAPPAPESCGSLL